LRSQLISGLADIAVERGTLEVALDLAHRAVHKAREELARDPFAVIRVTSCRKAQAGILESLGRLDEAMALDAESMALNPEEIMMEAVVRLAKKHLAVAEDIEAERILRLWIFGPFPERPKLIRNTAVAIFCKPFTLLAELLEKKGTEEALEQAMILKKEVAHHMEEYEVKRAAALEEMREVAAEAVRQWRKDRIKAVGGKKKGAKGQKKKKGKKKGRKGKARSAGTRTTAAIEGAPAGGEVEGAAAVEGAADAEAEQEAQVEDSQPPEEEEEREDCAICFEALELEGDEDPWGGQGGEGQALVVLRCGHRFHEVCGDMWCAKCADKGWPVTCPGCRAPYVVVRG
jgi:hypothetical protein